MKATSIIFISTLVVVVFGFALPQTTYAFHWFFSPPSTDVECGDVLEPSKKFKLVQDLNCTESPALTLRSGTELDMNGHTVMCSGGMVDVTALTVVTDSIGILLEGSRFRGALLKNGTVTGCEFGVSVAGSGFNLVEKVTAVYNGIGFEVVSSRNLLFDNHSDNINAGFSIFANHNKLTLNKDENSNVGFLIVSQENKLEGNRAWNNIFGFRIQSNNNWLGSNLTWDSTFGFALFSEHNKLTLNKDENSEIGFLIAGQENKLEGNRAWNNSNGYEIFANNNWLGSNHAMDNAFGFFIESDRNELWFNKAKSNIFGIFIEDTGQDNKIKVNVALDNVIRDLFDNNADCDNNTWRFNLFGTRNQNCIH